MKAAYEQHPDKWSKIATSVATRTDNQCRRRWTMLFGSKSKASRGRNVTRKAKKSPPKTKVLKPKTSAPAPKPKSSTTKQAIAKQKTKKRKIPQKIPRSPKRQKTSDTSEVSKQNSK